MQVSRLLQLVTNQLHYFYANQTKVMELIYNFVMLDIKKFLVIYEISTLYLKTFKFFQLKPINRNILYKVDETPRGRR